MSSATWAILGTALVLLIGNFAWVNPLAVRRRVVGLLVWLAGFGLILVFAGYAEKAISGAAHPQEATNYWIYFLVYLLISYPGFFVAMQQHARLNSGTVNTDKNVGKEPEESKPFQKKLDPAEEIMEAEIIEAWETDSEKTSPADKAPQ